jgi:hypothetical protein
MQKVLAEPFPWTVIQGVIPVFVIVNKQLKVLRWILSTQTTRLEPSWVRLQLASVKNDEKTIVGLIISFVDSGLIWPDSRVPPQSGLFG